MQFKVGDIVEGTVKSLASFGAFITLSDGSTGLVHISEVAHTYVSDIHDHLAEKQPVKVMIIGMDGNKINLSIKRTLPAPARESASRMKQSGAPRPSRPSSASAPSSPQPKSFDDMLKQFMTESDSKMSTIRAYADHKTKTRKR